jgi:NAD(P)-dependent dehydrogenase (short-subunit alcohol dehydrogenase family)
MNRLEGKVVVVTGAGRGIGRAAAIRFTAEGATAVGGDLDGSALKETESLCGTGGGRFLAVRADLTRGEEAAAVADAAAGLHGRIDGVFNNVGGGVPGTIEDLSEELWRAQLDLNLTTTFLMCKHCLPAMRANGGAIVNMSSTWGPRGVHGFPGYSAAKAGVVGLTRQLAVQYGPVGIRVNCLLPGMVDTPGGSGVDDKGRRTAAAETVARRERSAGRQPLGRLGRAEELAACALFLLSDDASFVTGAALVADGGMSVQYHDDWTRPAEEVEAR